MSGIKPFGSHKPESVVRDVVEFYLGSLNGSRSVKMEALVVHDTASIPNMLK